MDTEEVRKLKAIAARRRKLDKAIEALDTEEREAIAAAWRARMMPGEIAKHVDRSTAHVRKFRPEDVPPARTGGNAKRD